ncbi:hypothetical protein [Streptomyces sp. NPDC007904]|jgi:hypothetical protein|uniref:hypothetical protein n=1 Tax=Streptomyces sp. NPDC007904 TaxID=3364787 RepID=UPI0036EAB770
MTFKAAGAPAERHDVEIVSVVRHREHTDPTPHPGCGCGPWWSCAPVAGRKAVSVHPGGTVGQTALRAYCTVDNDLSLEVTAAG